MISQKGDFKNFRDKSDKVILNTLCPLNIILCLAVALQQRIIYLWDNLYKYICHITSHENMTFFDSMEPGVTSIYLSFISIDQNKIRFIKNIPVWLEFSVSTFSISDEYLLQAYHCVNLNGKFYGETIINRWTTTKLNISLGVDIYIERSCEGLLLSETEWLFDVVEWLPVSCGGGGHQALLLGAHQPRVLAHAGHGLVCVAHLVAVTPVKNS